MKKQEKIIKIVVNNVESHIISELLGSLSDGFWENDEWVVPYWMNLKCGYSNHLTIYYCNKKDYYNEAKPYPLFDDHIGKTFEFFADRLDELSEWKYGCDIPELEEEDYRNDICSASLKNLKLVYDNWRSYSESSVSNSHSETSKSENVKKVSESVDNLAVFIANNWHHCPFSENCGINWETECSGWHSKMCASCIAKNNEKLNKLNMGE